MPSKTDFFILKLFLYILVISFSSNLILAQDLELELKAIDSIENHIIQKVEFKKDHKNSESISIELLTISERFKREGYFLNKTDSLVAFNNKRIAYLTLGKKINIAILNIYDSKKTYKRKITPINELEYFIESISNNEEEKGNLFSETKLSNITLKKDTLFADVHIKKSTKRNIDKVIIKGYPEFSKKNLLHFLNINTNNTISNDKLEQISRNTKRLNFLSEIKSPEILFKKDSTLLYLYIKKRKSNSFDGIINFTSKEDEKGLLFTGHLKLDLNNIFNTGENVNLTWEANGEERQNISLSTELPYIFNSPLSTELNFKLHRQDSTFSTSSFNSKFLYNINNKLAVGLSYDSESSKNTLVNEIDGNLLNFNNNFIGISINYTNSLKNKFDFNLNPSIGNRTSENIKTNQYKLYYNTSYTYNINSRNAIFLRNVTSLLFTKDEITNELYRIGGANSIRGFNEEEIFTSKYSFLNFEYHYFTSQKSYFYSISDFGFTNSNFSSEQLIGLGLGYSFSHKKNLINLSTVVGKKIKNQFDLNNSKIILKFLTFF